jgi:hypothetical protein
MPPPKRVEWSTPPLPAFGEKGVHGFDLTFAAPKSVSLIRVLTDPVAEKVFAAAHEQAIAAAMAYRHQHAGYTRPTSGCARTRVARIRRAGRTFRAASERMLASVARSAHRARDLEVGGFEL